MAALKGNVINANAAFTNPSNDSIPWRTIPCFFPGEGTRSLGRNGRLDASAVVVEMGELAAAKRWLIP